MGSHQLHLTYRVRVVQGTEASLTPQVVLQLEKKLFDYFNQDVFRDNNGTAVSSV